MAEQNTSASLIIANMNLIDIDDALINNLIYVIPSNRSVPAKGMAVTNQAASRKRYLGRELTF